MTTNTGYRDKGRALLLAALMVVSIVGGAVAFSGGAAAVNSGKSQITLGSYQVSTDTVFTSNISTDNSTTPDLKNITVSFDGFDASGVTKSDLSVDYNGGGNGVSIDSISHPSTDTVKVTISGTQAISTGDTVEVSASVKHLTTPSNTGHYTSSITLLDSNGGQIDSYSEELDILDSTTAPSITDFSATNPSGQYVNVSITSAEKLETVSVDVSGAASTTLTKNDLTTVKNADGTYTYYSNQTYSSGTDGVYNATLNTAADPDGNDGASGQEASVTVDTNAPSFDYKSPSDTAKLTSVPDKIDIAVNDSLSNIDKSSIEVTLKSGGNTFVDTIDVTKPDDGISFTYASGDKTTGNLTITPSELPIQSFPDGTITVEVTAADAKSNSAQLSYDFELDTSADFTFSLSTPSDNNNDGVVLTKDPTQTIGVDVTSGASETLDYANITISNSTNSWSFNSTNSDVWSPSTFTIEPDTDLPKLVDGSYTISVNATDTAGNTEPDSTYKLNVDTTSPNVTDVSVNKSSVIKNGALNVTVDFNESVDVSTVAASITAGGDSGTIGAGNFVSASDDNSTVTATIDDISSFDGGNLDGVDNDSVIVQATAGEDIAGNGVDDKTANTTFSLDTENPTVTNNINDLSPISAYTNLTKKVTHSSDDGESVTYYIKKTSASSWDTISDPAHFDASQYSDDEYTISVNVTDDAGNMVSATKDVVIDLQSPSVTSSIDNGTLVTGSIQLDGKFSVQNNDSSVTWEYDILDSSGGSINTSVKTPYQLSWDSLGSTDGRTIQVKATATESGGMGAKASKTVTFVVDDVVVQGNTFTQKGENLQVTVTTDEKVDTLEAYVNSSDSFRDQVSKKLTASDFGTPSESGGDYTYTYNVSGVRDGEYELNLVDAANGSRNTVTDLSGSSENSTVLDNGNATVTNAYITGYDSNNDQTMVKLLFDEPVNDVDEVDFQGTNNDSVTVGDSDGMVTVELSGELQTGDAANINVTDATEAHSNSPATVDSNTTLHSIELSLSKGYNAVSIPAAAGSISASDLTDKANVDSVWKYDAENDTWDSFDPAAQENDFTELEGGVGYVVKANGSATIDLNVYNTPGGDTLETSTPTSQTLHQGWNLVGHYQEGGQSASTALQNVSYKTVYGQNAAGSLTFASTSNLKPGQAYWVFVTADGQVYAEASL